MQVYSDSDLAWARDAVANKFRDFGGTGYGQPGFLAGIRAHKILMLEQLHQKGPTISLEVQALRLDSETAIAFLPSEVFVELGLSLKKACQFMKFTDNFLRVDTTPGTLDWADDQPPVDG